MAYPPNPKVTFEAVRAIAEDLAIERLWCRPKDHGMATWHDNDVCWAAFRRAGFTHPEHDDRELPGWEFHPWWAAIRGAVFLIAELPFSERRDMYQGTIDERFEAHARMMLAGGNQRPTLKAWGAIHQHRLSLTDLCSADARLCCYWELMSAHYQPEA